MIKYLQLNIQMSILTQTFVEMSAEMYTFVFVLAILNGVWTSMAVILFGAAVNSFKDFSTSFETCFQLFIGLVSREVIFQELPQDENYNKPVEASIFYYLFTLVMVNSMFADMCNDLLEEWTAWAERRTAHYIPTCLKKGKVKSSQVAKDDEDDGAGQGHLE
jgi:hypothetical protein